jgi:glucuronate isomerase
VPQRDSLVHRLEIAIAEIPVLDVHTHLDAAHMSARGLADILLYHMVVSDLRSAGCPSGHRVEPGEEAARIQEALPYLPYIANTSCFYGVRLILRELYDFDEPITAANWEGLDARIRAASGDPNWARRILGRANVRRAMTLDVQRGDGSYDDLLEYSFELTYFCGAVSGRPVDAPVAELEAICGRPVSSLDDAREGLAAFFATIPYGRVRTTAAHLSTDFVYRPVSDDEMAAALTRRASGQPVPDDRFIFGNWLLAALLGELERHGDEIVMQFSFGAEPLPFETGSKADVGTVFQLVDLLQRFPGLRFNCFLASAYVSQALCTVARECPNLSFSAYWWHGFFPEQIRRLMNERLDMVALNKQVGFFSDAYCVEWTYAKAIIVRQELARVLAEKVERGQYTEELAVRIARHLLWETPRTLIGMGEGL